MGTGQACVSFGDPCFPQAEPKSFRKKRGSFTTHEITRLFSQCHSNVVYVSCSYFVKYNKITSIYIYIQILKMPTDIYWNTIAMREQYTLDFVLNRHFSFLCRWFLLTRMGWHCLLAWRASWKTCIHLLSRLHLWLQPQR